MRAGSREAFLSCWMNEGLWKATQAGYVLEMTRSHSWISSGVSLAVMRSALVFLFAPGFAFGGRGTRYSSRRLARGRRSGVKSGGDGDMTREMRIGRGGEEQVRVHPNGY